MKSQIIYLLILFILATSCHTSRSISTDHSTVDSVSKSKYDSLNRVHEKTVAEFQSFKHDSTTTDVIFDNDPCPNLDSLRLILDSAGKANLDKFISSTEEQIRVLKNKLKVNADGSFEAEGRIKSYRTTNEKINQENVRLSHERDSLNRLVKEKEDQLSKTADSKKTVVKKTFIPWWLWGLIILLGVLWLNERIGIIKIPFVTKTKIFNH